jgi:LmbE family N-acetylglucosaminyl deacetylase
MLMSTAGELHRRMQVLPMVDIGQLLKHRPPLVVSPHPDDESLGCGGLIAAACRAGLAPLVIILTDGTGSHPLSAQYPPDALRRLREREALDAVTALGLPADRLIFLGLRDTAAPRSGAAFETAITEIVKAAADHACGSLVATWKHDPHCDHEAAALMAREAAGRLGLPLWSYPVWGWTLAEDTELGDTPKQGCRLDISSVLPLKRAAIAAHRSQHGLVVTDTEGFCLPQDLLHLFDRPYEVFLGPIL